MAKNKRHITNEKELLKAMRSTGYCFPTNDIEQNLAMKLQPNIDIAALAKRVDPEAIWNLIDPIPYEMPKEIELKSDNNEFTESWGIAAKGNANISKHIMDKIKRNQKGNKQ